MTHATLLIAWVIAAVPIGILTGRSLRRLHQLPRDSEAEVSGREVKGAGVHGSEVTDVIG